MAMFYCLNVMLAGLSDKRERKWTLADQEGHKKSKIYYAAY